MPLLSGTPLYFVAKIYHRYYCLKINNQFGFKVPVHKLVLLKQRKI